MDHSLNLIGPRFIVALLLSLILLAASTGATAQQPARGQSAEHDRGIQLYQQGDATGAIAALRAATRRNQNDISAWHYLGLSFEKAGKKNDARKAHEKAAKIADSVLTLSSDRPETLTRTQLLEAADSADQYLALTANPSKKKKEEWHDRAEFLRVFTTDRDLTAKAYSGKDVTTKPRILEKPEPQYTEEARRHQIRGIVVLRCVFSANGRVTNIVPIRGLRYGLTRKAMNAAYGIKFIPATKDGHPVSMYMQLEYNFNLY
jgi:TonB family protein